MGSVALLSLHLLYFQLEPKQLNPPLSWLRRWRLPVTLYDFARLIFGFPVTLFANRNPKVTVEEAHVVEVI